VTIKRTVKQKELILSFIREHDEITTREVSELLQVSVSRGKVLLHQLVNSGEIVSQGDNKNRSYRLSYDEHTNAR